MNTIPGRRAARGPTEAPFAEAGPATPGTGFDPSIHGRRPGRRFTALLGASLALVGTGCLQDTAKIGVVLPLSGEDQLLGEESQRGLTLAAKSLVSETGGAPLELLIRDSGSDPAQAAQQLSILLGQESAIAAIGGVTTAEARALVPVAEERERVLLSPSAGDQNLSATSRMVYRLSHSDASAGATLAAFVRNRLDLDSAVVMAQDDSYARSVEEGFVDTFRSLGGELLDRPAAGDGDLATAAETVAGAGPGAAILNGEDEWLEPAIAALRSAGFEGRIFGPQSLADPSAREALGERAQGVYFTHAAFDPANPGDAGSEFVQRYREAYGEEPTVFAAEAYDALRVLARALRDRPPLPGEVRRGLRDEIKAYPGVTGSLEFDDTGSVSKFPRVFGRDDQLALYDYGDWLEKEKQRIEEERRQLELRLAEIRRRAAQGAGGP